MNTKSAQGVWRSKALHVFTRKGHAQYSPARGVPARLQRQFRILAESGETNTFLIADKGGRQHLRIPVQPAPAPDSRRSFSSLWHSLREFAVRVKARFRHAA